MCDNDPTLDGTLPHANALCILRYEPHGGRQVDTEEDGEDQQEGREETGQTGPGPASRPPSRQGRLAPIGNRKHIQNAEPTLGRLTDPPADATGSQAG